MVANNIVNILNGLQLFCKPIQLGLYAQFIGPSVRQFGDFKSTISTFDIEIDIEIEIDIDNGRSTLFEIEIEVDIHINFNVILRQKPSPDHS
jgi:hypothetical protein